MPNIPDRDNTQYEKVIARYKQLRKKLARADDAYIDAANNKTLFKEMRDALIDIMQLIKISNGVQRDDDVAAP